jgi:hypothetical protein
MTQNTVSQLKYGNTFSFISKPNVKFQVTEMMATYMRYSAVENGVVLLDKSFYINHPKCSSKKIVSYEK